MLIDDSSISMRTSLLLLLLLVQEKKKNPARSEVPHKRTRSRTRMHVARCDPARCALASGCLEVSGDAVSACGSGCIGLGLMGTCSNFPGSFCGRRERFLCFGYLFLGNSWGNVPFPRV